MSATIRQQGDPVVLFMKMRPLLRVYRQPFTLLVCRVAAGVTCLLMAIPNGISAPASPTGEKTSAPLLTDDGFTRETLMEFTNPPEPRSLASAPTASLDESTPQNRGHMVLHHHHRRHHKVETPDDQRQQVVVAKPSHRRNPAESFVYWWNGWVIRNFHTRNGTVLLDSIGAKT